MTWILGKHPSILEWPRNFFLGKDSIGLNSIPGYGFQVDRVMTGHIDNLKIYKEKGIPRRKWILVRPMFDAHTIGSSGYWINWNRHRKPHQHVDLTPDEILTYLKRARHCFLNGNKNGHFPNFWSVLHLAIFFAITEGSSTIHLAGCNNEPGRLQGASTFNHSDYARRHTQMLIDAAPQVGVKIHWHKSWKSYQDWVTSPNEKEIP